jgi:aminomuconate-semialdehyde/2-hydroxymuconate-6-semialdehyde dehydrogenase
MIEIINNYINGKLIISKSKEYIDIFEPATGDIYARVPNSKKSEIDEAIYSAKKAFLNWSNIPIEQRSNYLLMISKELQKSIKEFANYESRDTGKPISLSLKLDIPRAIENLTFFSKHALEFKKDFQLQNQVSKNNIISSPLGVVTCITPWNLPLYLFTWKIAPALIMGNTIVAKPSEITPYTAYKFGEICKKIGLPPGVLNIINGNGDRVGNMLTSHPDIKAISFTGGTVTGKKIIKESSKNFKKLTLEMGGKNPSIIFNDCDYNNMLETVIKSSFNNQGQICLCSSRLLIEKNIYEKFKLDFCEKVSELIIGDPINPKTDFGAITSKAQYGKILRFIQLSKKEGGSILAGGKVSKLKKRCEKGWFIEPTVIENLSLDSTLHKEEIFGPIVTLQTFSSEEEAIELANNTKYGLSATVWTNDFKKANRVAKKIESGVIWINCWMVRDLRTPFGGIKDSGFGKEGGDDALRFFTEQKNICSLV